MLRYFGTGINWRGELEVAGHILKDCQAEESRQTRAILSTMEDRFQQRGAFENYSGCFWCKVAQSICNQWKQAEDKAGFYQRQAGREYQYQGTIISGWVGISYIFEEKEQEEFIRRLEKKGIDWQDQESVIKC